MTRWAQGRGMKGSRGRICDTLGDAKFPMEAWPRFLGVPREVTCAILHTPAPLPPLQRRSSPYLRRRRGHHRTSRPAPRSPTRLRLHRLRLHSQAVALLHGCARATMPEGMMTGLPPLPPPLPPVFR